MAIVVCRQTETRMEEEEPIYVWTCRPDVLLSTNRMLEISSIIAAAAELVD